MRVHRYLCVLLILSCAALAEHKSHPPASTQLPITTSSKTARQHFDKAMQDLAEVRLPELAGELREATKADPDFAQAWILLAHFTHSPDEQQMARNHAKQSASHGTPAEQLLVRWFANAEEDNYVPAIAAMNDLLAMYPRDYQLTTLAGGWLFRQQRYEQSVSVLERAVSIAPQFADAYNELGYAYATMGDYPKAITAMQRYVELMPNEPNPHDSYGEILRMAGKFEPAIEEFRKSIQLDPSFGSELGVADTYAVMGREDDARAEYGRAIVFAPSESDKVEYELDSAITWIREDNRKQAEKALRAAGKHAHAAGLARLEAETHRVLALYEADYKNAVKELDAAEKTLAEPHPMSQADRTDEHARILLVRALRACEAHANQDASAAAGELETMAQDSRSQVVQLAYHAAQGAVLLEKSSYADAISHLQEDPQDPLALRLLWRAYSNSGNSGQADATAAKLMAMNVPTAEQALVVPQFRAKLVSQTRIPQ